MAFNFNYDKFYTYYTNKNNYIEESNEVILFYYVNHVNTKKLSENI